MQRRKFLALPFMVAGCAATGRFSSDDLVSVLFGDTTIFVIQDYYMVDGVRMPVGLTEAYRIADERGMRLPTSAMVDAIWRAADVQLEPIPMDWRGPMTSMAYFIEHDRLIDAQLGSRSGLTAGHKKDIVEAGRDNPNAAIYGWHYPNGGPIQGHNNRDHGREYRDYSHGLRLVLT